MSSNDNFLFFDSIRTVDCRSSPFPLFDDLFKSSRVFHLLFYTLIVSLKDFLLGTYDGYHAGCIFLTNGITTS